LTRGTYLGGSLLFFSGAAALVFQLLWVKQLSIVVGVDVYAITVAVSAFFGGLAVGGAVFGRAADRTPRPLRLYATLEATAAVTSITATMVLARSAAAFAVLDRSVGLIAWVLPFALVGLPAVFMGGTLPAIVCATGPRSENVAAAGGGLYAANTAGAVAGVVATVLVLIPSLGIRGSALTVTAVQLVLAALALMIDFTIGRTENTELGRRPTTNNQGLTTNDQRLAIVLYSVSGAIALGYEVVWSQILVQLTSTRSFAFAVVLATYLSGLALGSGLWARFRRRRDPWVAFGVLIAGAGFLALALEGGLDARVMTIQSDVEELVRRATSDELSAMLGRFAVAAVSVVFLPTIALGAAFPAALRLAAGDDVGRRVGALLAWNTAGGIAGTLIVGFVLIPAIGLIHTLAALAMAASVVGIVSLGRAQAAAGSRLAIYGLAAGTLLLAAVTPPDHLARLLPVTRGGGDVAYYSESAGGSVAVVTQPGPRPFQRLYIQGVSNSGDAMTSLRYMRLQALLPLIVHAGEPRSALVIGFGTGITAGALTQYPGLDRRVCAELLPAVVGASSLFQGNFGAGSSNALEIRLRDGRRELLASEEQYDLITLEPPPPSAAGVVNLYSRDFYELARKRLRSNGILAQWWPLPTQNDEDSRALVRAFLDVFPHASLWTTELHEMLLVGSADPLRLAAQRIAGRFNQPAVAAALREVGVASAEALLATWVTGRDGLERYARNVKAVTDDWPSIEYGTWVRRDEFLRMLPDVLALRTRPPLTDASEEFLSGVSNQREALMQFYEAGLAAYKGDREAWTRALNAALRDDPNNPYFRWIAGSTEF